MAHFDFTHWSEEARMAYAAGIMDGEGYIGIARYPGVDSYVGRVSVAQAEPRDYLVDVLAGWFPGGKRYGPHKHKGNRVPSRIIIWQNDDALELLERINQFIILKNIQSCIVIRCLRALRSARFGKRVSWSVGLKELFRNSYRECKRLTIQSAESSIEQHDPPAKEPTLFDD